MKLQMNTNDITQIHRSLFHSTHHYMGRASNIHYILSFIHALHCTPNIWEEQNSNRRWWLHTVVWCGLLRWLFLCAVSIKGLQLKLDSVQRVGKGAVVQNGNGLLNPLQEIRAKWLILDNQPCRLHHAVENLTRGKQEYICSSHMDLDIKNYTPIISSIL